MCIHIHLVSISHELFWVGGSTVSGRPGQDDPSTPCHCDHLDPRSLFETEGLDCVELCDGKSRRHMASGRTLVCRDTLKRCFLLSNAIKASFFSKCFPLQVLHRGFFCPTGTKSNLASGDYCRWLDVTLDYSFTLSPFFFLFFSSVAFLVMSECKFWCKNTLAVARVRLTGRGAVGSVCFDVPVLPCVQIGQGHCCLFYI